MADSRHRTVTEPESRHRIDQHATDYVRCAICGLVAPSTKMEPFDQEDFTGRQPLGAWRAAAEPAATRFTCRPFPPLGSQRSPSSLEVVNDRVAGFFSVREVGFFRGLIFSQFWKYARLFGAG